MASSEYDFVGVQIGRVVTREFWCAGLLSCPCCPFVIEDNNRFCWQICFDDELECWAVVRSNQVFPELGTQSGDRGLLWKNIEVAFADALVGKTVVSLRHEDNTPETNLIVQLENQSRIRFSHNFQRERSEFTFQND